MPIGAACGGTTLSQPEYKRVALLAQEDNGMRPYQA